MAFPRSEGLAFGPRSTLPSNSPPTEYGCHCHPMGSLERLPLFHALLDRAAGSFIGRIFGLILQIIISVSIVLMAKGLLRRLMTIFECMDCIGFLFVCCIEVLFPSLNRLVWGEIGQMPPACCVRSNAAFHRRRRPSSSSGSSTNLPHLPTDGPSARLTSSTVLADSSPDAVHFMLPPAYTFRSRTSSSVDVKKSRATDSPVVKYEERKDHLADFIGTGGVLEPEVSLFPPGPETNSEPAEIQVDNPLVGNNHLASPIPVKVSPLEQPSPTAAHDTEPIEDMKRLSARPTISQAGNHLLGVSSTVTSRLHKHWLRPCSACAETQKLETRPKKLVKKQQRIADESTERAEGATDMYHRSISWIRKQEDKMVRHQE